MLTVLQASRHSAAGAAGEETTAAKKHVCVYDAWNRLVEVWHDDGVDRDPPGGLPDLPDRTLTRTGPEADTLLVTYRYDGLNRRIVKLLGTDPANPGEQYDYYYNTSWQVVEVRKDAQSRAHKQYVWDLRGNLPRPRGVDSPVLRDRDAADDGDTSDYGKTNSGLEERVYYTNDANFNVTPLVDTSGSVVERYSYDPYAKVSFYDGSWSERGSSSYDNEILYCGYRYDPETGLYHVRHRPYHPTLGRWPVRDFQEYIDSVSLYEYCVSSPVDLYDPSGLMLPGAKRLAALDEYEFLLTAREMLQAELARLMKRSKVFTKGGQVQRYQDCTQLRPKNWNNEGQVEKYRACLLGNEYVKARATVVVQHQMERLEKCVDEDKKIVMLAHTLSALDHFISVYSERVFGKVDRKAKRALKNLNEAQEHLRNMRRAFRLAEKGVYVGKQVDAAGKLGKVLKKANLTKIRRNLNRLSSTMEGAEKALGRVTKALNAIQSLHKQSKNIQNAPEGAERHLAVLAAMLELSAQYGPKGTGDYFGALAKAAGKARDLAKLIRKSDAANWVVVVWTNREADGGDIMSGKVFAKKEAFLSWQWSRDYQFDDGELEVR